MLSATFFIVMLTVVMPNIVMPNVIMPNVVMPKVIMANVVMPNVFMPNVLAPFTHFSKLNIRVKRLNIKLGSQMDSLGSLMLSSVSEEPHYKKI